MLLDAFCSFSVCCLRPNQILMVLWMRIQASFVHNHTIRSWCCQLSVLSLIARKYVRDKSKKVKLEGVAFYHPDEISMRKLRLDTFD